MATPGNALSDTEWVPLSLTLVEYPKGTHITSVRALNEKRLF